MSLVPNISVIIPTRERWAALERTLHALAAQEFDGSFEVVVVDNGSADGSLEKLTELATGGQLPFPLTPVPEPVPGAAAARNRGLEQAKGDLVVFIGDDTRPARPDFLAGHLREHQTSPGPQS